MNTGKLGTPDEARRKSANLRTAVVFASVAVVFFFGIIAARMLGGPVIGVGVMGAIVLLFLVLAIGRNLRMSEGGESQGRSREQGEAKERSSRLRTRVAADSEVQREDHSDMEAAPKGASPSDCGGRPSDPVNAPPGARRPRK